MNDTANIVGTPSPGGRKGSNKIVLPPIKGASPLPGGENTGKFGAINVLNFEVS